MNPLPLPRRTRSRGLTLIELMIGLAMLAILTSLAASPFSAWLARNRVKAVANQLVADLGDARHEATRRGAPLRVNFQTGAQWCYAITLDPELGCSAAATNASVLKRVTSKDLRGVTITNAEPMDFNNGNGGILQPVSRVRLVSSQGDVLQVKTTRIGRASVCAPEGAITGVPHC